jgi:predicted ATPase/DNA-binding SARP family transcriptional activator
VFFEYNDQVYKKSINLRRGLIVTTLPISIHLLGAPVIEQEGVPISVDTRKAIALLAYLVITEEQHTRDTLATLLWPDNDQTRARAALRRTLSTLNKALDRKSLNITRETVGIKHDTDLWVDVWEFHNRLQKTQNHAHPIEEGCPRCLNLLAEAVDLYRDDFLAGFTLRDSPNFDDWQFFETEALRRDLANALERLSLTYASQGDFIDSLASAQRWLSLDKLHEPAHRTLMKIYTWTGRRNAAIRQYRQCVRILDDELGVSPLEETTDLYQAILENRLPSPTQRGHSPRKVQSPAIPLAESPVMDYPIVGREKELADLLDVYSKLEANGEFFVIEGEAGIGKTRLGDEFCQHIKTQGSFTVSSQCYPGEGDLAYEPIIDSLRKSIAKEQGLNRIKNLTPLWLSEAARLLPELASLHADLPLAPPLDSPGAQSRLYEAICQIMSSMANQNTPAVFFFDDIHWADEATIGLLTYLVRRLAGRPLFILVTWRGDLVPTDHPLQQLLSDAQRSGYGKLLKLTRLNLSEVETLIQMAYTNQDSMPPNLAQMLYKESEGLPFFVTEYMSTFAANKSTWEEDEWVMPRGVRNLLMTRLSPVNEAGLQLLQTAAVIGRSFDLSTIQATSGRSEEETIRALDDLLQVGLIREIQRKPTDATTGFKYDFMHNKLRSLIYQETSLARRMLLHRRVAEALVLRTPKTELPTLAGRIARHYKNSGQPMEAAKYFKQAGEYAQSLFANEDALTNFREALALGYEDKVQIHQAIGDLFILMADYAEALASYETAASLAGSEALPMIEHKLGTIHQRQGEWQLASCHYQAALEGLADSNSSSLKARIYADWCLAAQESGDSDHARELIQQAISNAEISPDPLALAQVYNIFGILDRDQRNYKQAIKHLNMSLDIATADRDLSLQIAALNNLSLVHADQLDYDHAISLAQSGLDLCRQVGDLHHQAALENNLADYYHASGQQEKAMTHLKQAVVIFAEIGEDGASTRPEIWKLTEW